MVFCNMDFSASKDELEKRHNPYFSRWFSAMVQAKAHSSLNGVTILILVDGFLQ